MKAKPKQVMVYVDGSKTSFRCENLDARGRRCGCNVFTQMKEGQYRCNSCLVTYTGER